MKLMVTLTDYRKVAELQASLSDSIQKIGKLNEELEQKKVESEKETEILIAKHEEDLKSFQQRLDDAVSNRNRMVSKIWKRFVESKGLIQDFLHC